MNDDVDDLELDPVNNNSPFFSNFSTLSKSHKSSYEKKKKKMNLLQILLQKNMKIISLKMKIKSMKIK